jgi:hypothetical protein
VEGFEAQTPGFVTGVTDGLVHFGYQGQRTGEIARGITVEEASWFYGYAGRMTDAALRTGLASCGASDEEAARFASALLDRIQQIGVAAGCIREDPRRTIKAG